MCVCGLQALNRVVVGVCFVGDVSGFVFFKAEPFLYAWAQFPIEGTADCSSKMGLGKVSQRK